jgi:hypothetical protein
MAAMPEKTDGRIEPGKIADIASEKDGLKDISGKEALINERELPFTKSPFRLTATPKLSLRRAKVHLRLQRRLSLMSFMLTTTQLSVHGPFECSSLVSQ